MRRLSPDQRKRRVRIAAIRARREAHRKPKRFARRLKREVALSGRRQFAERHGVLFDRNLARAQIVLPAVFSFHRNHRETTEAIARMRQAALRDGRPVMVHLSAVTELDPSAALALVAEIFRIRHLRSQSTVTGSYPRSRTVYELLVEMGFFKLLQIEEHYGIPKDTNDPSRPVFLPFISGNKVEAKDIDAFVAVIEKQLIPMNDVARGKLVGAIIEAMNNTLDHAHPHTVHGETMPNRWWMSSWINVADREVMIMVFDQGVGIPVTLTPTRYERIRSALAGNASFPGLTAQPSDGEIILAATELYRTSTHQRGRGKGFRNMKQFVSACSDGQLRVLSNRGRYSYMRGTERFDNESLSIGGTMIEWRFRHEGSVEMEDE